MNAIIIDPTVSLHADVSKHADLVRDWKSYCHDKQTRRHAVIVDYSAIRETSRWQCERRARPFLVRSAYDLEILTTSKTLDGALKLAKQWAAFRGA